MALTNSICTNNKQIDIQSGTGALNIGTKASANTITIGNSTGASALALNSGSGGVTASGGFFTALPSGNARLDSTSGDIYIGNGATNNLLSIGAAGNKTINIGNSSSSGSLSILNGGGSMYIQASNGPIAINSGSGFIEISNDAANTSVNIASGAGVKTLVLGSNNSTSSITIYAGSGGITVPSLNNYGVVGTTNAGLLSSISASTAGYVLTSNGTSALPTFQAIAAPFAWNNVTGSSQTMVVGNGYVNNGSGTPTVFTLPATAAVGAQVAIQGNNSGLWQIAQNSGQTINFNGVSSTTGVTGTITSTDNYDAIYLLCVTANTDWVATSFVGNLDVV
jgi:autotransporter family porin